MRLILFVFACLTLQWLVSCNERFENKSAAEGYELAKASCASCHGFPGAELLPKNTWSEYVLPKMSRYYGIQSMGFNRYVKDDTTNAELSLDEWNKILLYYLTASPRDSLAAINPTEITDTLNRFSAETVFLKHNPATTFIGSGYNGGDLLVADGFDEKLYFIRGDSFRDSISAERGISNISISGDSMYVLSMGVLYPSDDKLGFLKLYTPKNKNAVTVLSQLQRPVYHEFADLNNDGRTDIVVCEFGDLQGQLSWFENSDGDDYTKHILRPLPGAVKTVANDFNKDGYLDILALMAQGYEGFFMYYNDGKGNFREEKLLQLSPSFGSNYFELADFNNDGHLDILATNGDNGDYPPVLKPYHGIRIYLNNGDNTFKEKLFLQMNGACKAMARDFDGDGDLDIAAISYFPDYSNKPEEAFLYFENKSSFTFIASALKESTYGRWLTMHCADTDDDGDTDIILGNAPFALGSVPEVLRTEWQNNSIQVLQLRNRKNKPAEIQNP